VYRDVCADPPIAASSTSTRRTDKAIATSARTAAAIRNQRHRAITATAAATSRIP
jgi:hypothetical protein